MDATRFDRLTRTLGQGRTRRAAVRSAGAAVAAGLLGRAAAPAPAEAKHFCSWEGCACQQGQFDATGCDDPLTCCINGGGSNHGTGVCTVHCGVQCISPDHACDEGCPWYGPCYGCCSGQCENGYCTWA